jgi:hypothetical protein
MFLSALLSRHLNARLKPQESADATLAVQALSRCPAHQLHLPTIIDNVLHEAFD